MYRLGDSIRHNNVGIPKGSFSELYYSRKNKTMHIDFDTLYECVINNSLPSAPKKSLVIHLRLFDWITWPHAGKCQLDDYIHFFENNKDLIEQMEHVFILYGCTNNSNKKESDEFVENLMMICKEYKLCSEVVSSNNTDTDFKFMVTSDYFIPSYGGYGTMAASINRHCVFWDISDKGYSSYKSPNELKDIKLFKENYYNKKLILDSEF